jgi:hypothetical protein
MCYCTVNYICAKTGLTRLFETSLKHGLVSKDRSVEEQGCLELKAEPRDIARETRNFHPLISFFPFSVPSKRSI